MNDVNGIESDFILWCVHGCFLLSFLRCVHCQNMAADYGRAARTLRKRTPQVLLAKVDTTIEQALSNRYDVHKYPTLFISHRGNMTEYEGTFSAEGKLLLETLFMNITIK